MPGTQTGRLDLSYKEAQRSSILRPGTIFGSVPLVEVDSPFKRDAVSSSLTGPTI